MQIIKKKIDFSKIVRYYNFDVFNLQYYGLARIIFLSIHRIFIIEKNVKINFTYSHY